MRILMLIAVGLAFVVSSGPSMAQKINSSLYPWERKAGQLRGVTQRDPMAKIRARDEKGLKFLRPAVQQEISRDQEPVHRSVRNRRARPLRQSGRRQ
jgi:hypothetical protein